MASGDFVSYIRVSTRSQGESRLGLEAQQRAINVYLNGGDWRIIKEFVEVELGRKSDRPVLALALAHASLYRIPLIVAKVDRLTRSAAFLQTILESGADVNSATCLRSKALSVVSSFSKWQALPSWKPA